MTRNDDGTYTIRASTIRWALGIVGTMIVGGLPLILTAIGTAWSFTSAMREDMAVVKTQVATLSTDVHELKQNLGIGMIAERNGDR